MTTKRLTRDELPEIEAWALQIVEDANGYAERAEAARGAYKRELMRNLDALATSARQVASMSRVLHE